MFDYRSFKEDLHMMRSHAIAKRYIILDKCVLHLYEINLNIKYILSNFFYL